MRAKAGRVCARRWQKVEKRVVYRCVQDEWKSVDTELKGALVGARREGEFEKRCEGEGKREQ